MRSWKKSGNDVHLSAFHLQTPISSSSISGSKNKVSGIPRVIHFEIAIDEPDRAVKFYSEVFGWKVEKWGPVDYWLVQTGEGPGIDGALKMRERPHESTTNTVEVPSLEKYMEKVVEKGAR